MGARYCKIDNIYGDRAILVPFWYRQENESYSCEVEMSISQPIFTHKKISKYLWDNNFNAPQYGIKSIVLVLHFYSALYIFLLFCDHQDTES